MGRSIVKNKLSATATRGGPVTSSSGDEYGDRLLKLIPAEVIALFLAMDGVITDNGDNSLTMSFIVFAIGLFATWFYLRIFLKVTNIPQIAISVVAFGVWAINLGHGFQEADFIKPSYAAIALLVFTFFAPKIPMGEEEKPLPPL